VRILIEWQKEKDSS